MAKPLHIVHLEDDANDAALVAAALEQDGLECRIEAVRTREAFVAALGRGCDLILSDFSIPGFDGLTALHLAAKTSPDTPFLLVSGTLAEEAAIASLQGGATDYVLKHRLSLLGPAVNRALQEARERRTRHEAELALRREQHFLGALLDCLQTGIVACEADGTIRLFNRAARDMHGLPDETLSIKQRSELYSLYHADGHTLMDLADRPLSRALRGERVRDAELVIRPKDQKPRLLLVSGQPIIDEHGECLGAVVSQHDVSERKELEEQLRQAQKMEAVGRLAGGVAHDFNNLLTAIMGYGEILKRKLGPDHFALDDMSEILKAADRAASLTRQLLAFSRQQVLEPRILDLNVLVAEMDKMLRRVIGEDIDLATIAGAQLGRVKADPGQIEQVLMNLVVNARDAMPEGGRLTIETANVDFAEGDRPASAAGRYVFLAVSDTGCGMSPDVAARIFEPFFTTKEPGRGTGLGLSTVHGIVRQSEGQIEVITEPGHGTTFKMYFPRVDEAVEVRVEQAVSPEHCEGNEVVLVVDDEDAIRRVIRDSLEPLGYRVIDAADGKEALAMCARREQPIDLLITDIVMPLMTGPQLVNRLTRRWPGVRVLFISGYMDRALVHQGMRAAGTAFLQKPFSPSVLARGVRKVLDEPREAAA